MKKLLVTIALAITGISGASAQIFKTINSAEMTAGFMNVFNLPSAGGAFQFASGWGVSDLRASFGSPTEVTMLPNTIGDPDPYWYTPSGGVGALGNKMMEANLYGQVTGTYAGTNVVFEGITTSFSLATNAAGIPYTLTAFIRDFAPDFSSFATTTLVITNTGAFSINLNTINDAGRHVQWGLQLFGPNIWGADAAQLSAAGSATVQAVPEPSTYALLALGAAGLGAHLVRRRRR
jgi:hypothetical protein